MRRARNSSARPFPTSRHGNEQTDRCPHFAFVIVIPIGKPFDILPTKVQARLPRLSRAYALEQLPLSLSSRYVLSHFTPLREAQEKTKVINHYVSIIRRHRSMCFNYGKCKICVIEKIRLRFTFIVDNKIINDASEITEKNGMRKQR